MLTHGESGSKAEGRKATPEFRSWTSMRERCQQPSHPGWKYYGGRGIKVCDRWLGREGFLNFLADMGRKPTPKHQIDRYPNNDGNYEPSNCRWATASEQFKNRPPVTRHRSPRKDSTSGIAGVQPYPLRGKIYWRAIIDVRKKRIRLGIFSSKKKAAQARREAERLYEQERKADRLPVPSLR